jgi:hypothetical protein
MPYKIYASPPGGQPTYGVPYGYDPTLVLNNGTTGAFRPFFVTPSQSAGFAVVAGGQYVLQSGYYSAQVQVVSGNAYINGTGEFPTNTRIELGGNGAQFVTPLVVGCTGGKAIVTWTR